VILLAVFLLLILVLLAPTILSTGWARALVLSQVNDRLNGTVQIRSWSLGWFSPIQVDGIVINDASNRQIFQLPQFSTRLTLLNVLRGKYNLGETRIEGLDILVSREPDGSINWQHLARSGPSTTSEKTSAPSGTRTQETKLPDVDGEVVLSNCSLTYEDRTGVSPPVYLRSIQVDVKIPRINEPITDSFSAQAVVGANPPGTITAGGTIDAVSNNVLAIDAASIDQTLKLAGLDLGAVSGLIGSAVPANLSGRADGDLVLHLTKGANGTVQANLVAQKIAATGGNLADNHFSAGSLELHLPSATLQLPGGASKAAENAKIDLGSGLTLRVANINLAQGQGSSARNVIAGDSLSVDARGAYTASTSGKSLGLTSLELSDAQNTFSVRKAQDSEIALSLPNQGKPTAKGGIELAADLKRLSDVAESFSAKVEARDDSGMKLQSGKVAGKVSFAQADADHIFLIGDLAVTQISVGNPTSSPIKDEKIQLTFKAIANNNLSEVSPTLDVTGDLVSAHFADAQFSLTSNTSTFQRVKKFTLTIEVPSLPKLQAIVRSFSPAKPSTARLAPGPALAYAGKIPPRGSTPSASEGTTDVSNGSGMFTFKAEPDGANLHIISQAIISNLALKQAESTYALSSIVLNSDDTLVPTTAGQIQEIRVVRNDVDVNDLAIKGKPYPEKRLHVATVLTLQPTTHVLYLKNLSVETASTKALALVAQGRILDLGSAQRIENVLTFDLDYDASQLLNLIVPVMSPDMQAKMKDAQASGKYKKHFEVRGAYPSGQEFGKAIQQVLATGDIQLDSFEGAGISLRKVDLPFVLGLGVLRIIYPDRPTGQNLPPAMELNGGTFNIGGSAVDLRGATPTLSILDNFPVLDNVSLNPILAAGTLGAVNPLFVDAKAATGFANVRVLSCRDLPLDSSVTSPNAAGTVSLDIAIRQLEISNEILQKLAGVARMNMTSLRGDIPSYHVSVEHGILDQNLLMTFAQGHRPLKLFGKVRLADKQLLPLTIDLPWKLFGIKGVPKGVEGFMPEGIEIPMTGTLTNPQFAFDFNKFTQNAARKAIPGILDGQNDQQPSSQPAEQPDPLKQLQDLINRSQKKKK
jgi:hypothetical protein